MPGEITAIPNSNMLRSGIYLCEEGEYVGPFQSRHDAKRFLLLMMVFGCSCVGIEIVEICENANPMPQPG